MIREFWQNRKEEKKRLKELKKQNKKSPAAREQRAYKIFGICLALFVIFGAFFRACGGNEDTSMYSWESLSGITEEMKGQLEQTVNKKDLLFNKQIDVVDWSYCKDILVDSGVGAVIVEDKIDRTALIGDSVNITSTISLNNRMLGALSQKLIESSLYSGDVELIEVVLEPVDNKLSIKSLMQINLTTVVFADKLPTVFVTTTSTAQVLNNKLYSLNSNCKINKLEESENSDIVEMINNNSLSTLESFTNELIAKEMNKFAEGINAKLRINGSNIELY